MSDMFESSEEMRKPTDTTTVVLKVDWFGNHYNTSERNDLAISWIKQAFDDRSDLPEVSAQAHTGALVPEDPSINMLNEVRELFPGYENSIAVPYELVYRTIPPHITMMHLFTLISEASFSSMLYENLKSYLRLMERDYQELQGTMDDMVRGPVDGLNEGGSRH